MLLAHLYLLLLFARKKMTEKLMIGAQYRQKLNFFIFANVLALKGIRRATWNFLRQDMERESQMV